MKSTLRYLSILVPALLLHDPAAAQQAGRRASGTQPAASQSGQPADTLLRKAGVDTTAPAPATEKRKTRATESDRGQAPGSDGAPSTHQGHPGALKDAKEKSGRVAPAPGAETPGAARGDSVQTRKRQTKPALPERRAKDRGRSAETNDRR